jgi:hypothetical protein
VILKWILITQTASYGVNASISSHQARLHRVHHPYFSSIANNISRHEKSQEKKLMTCSAAVVKIESLVFEKMASSQEIDELSSSTLLSRPLKVPQQQQQCETTEGRLKE